MRQKLSNVVYLPQRSEDGRHGLLERTVDEHEAALMRFLRLRLANEPDREDVAQEVFLRLCRQADLEGKLAFGVEKTRAYLFTIANNIIRDMKRRDAVRRSDAHEAMDEKTVRDDKPSVEQRLEFQQELDAIESALGRLAPKCRRAFVLSRFRLLSYKEIADEMGVSSSMVEKYISKALGELRRSLNRDRRR